MLKRILSNSVLLLLVVSLLPRLLPAQESAPVKLGIDVLRESGFALLEGQRVGLITNHTGLDARGQTSIDLLSESQQVKLVRLFGPEHGLRGEFDQSMIEDGADQKTGLPVVSLYGPRRAPTQQQLADLDTLVFDIQDIGCRFYTYIATMKLAMKAAAQADVRFVVLDRPNPIDGVTVEGPLRDAGEDTFVACHMIPVRHGMTIGELARMFVADEGLKLDLEIVKVTGWQREHFWDQTGLLWTNQSPNMRRLTAALLYPGIGLLETTNISVGRGTDTPFEVLGAPWIDPWQLQAELTAERLPGVRFVPRYFTPTASKHAGERCGGVDIFVTDRAKLRAVDLGLAVARVLRKLYPNEWKTSPLPKLLVSEQIHQAIEMGAAHSELSRLSRDGVDDFVQRRGEFLLY